MMDKRGKTCLAIIACGTLFIGWRIVAIVGRLTPATVIASPQSAEPRQVEGDASDAVAVVDQRLGEMLKAQQEVESGIWGRVPFDPAPFETHGEAATDHSPIEMKRADPPAPPKVQFTGVSKAGDRWLAAVNGEIVALGDSPFEGFSVAAITRSSITLVSEGWAFRYELGQTSPDIRPQSEKP